VQRIPTCWPLQRVQTFVMRRVENNGVTRREHLQLGGRDSRPDLAPAGFLCPLSLPSAFGKGYYALRTHSDMLSPNEGRRIYLRPPEDDPDGGAWMRFRLTYEGELRPSQRDPENGQREPLAMHKQRMRKVFHGQLKQLWQTNKFLKEHGLNKDEIHLRPGHVSPMLGVGFYNVGPRKLTPLIEYIASNFQRDGYRFVPLVCEDFSLLCSLDILFLRRDFPIGVISAGDLDNRVKTLIDALRMPKGANELRGNETPEAGEDPFFCLLEDDDLVTALSVESGMLLDPPSDGDWGDGRVKLVISVELKPDDITMFNLGFA
jgi:hypothetical protein